MAKIKVSALAEELGRESKEVLTFFKSIGVESAKIATSSVEEADALKAREYFKGAESKKENKTTEKVNTPNEAAVPDTATANAQQPVKKKKKIIFVSNPNNSKISGSKSQAQPGKGSKPGDGRLKSGARGGFTRSQNAYHPIKPLTAPTQPESYQNDNLKNSQKQAPQKIADKIEEKTAAVEETRVLTKETVTEKSVETAKSETNKGEAKKSEVKQTSAHEAASVKDSQGHKKQNKKEAPSDKGAKNASPKEENNRGEKSGKSGKFNKSNASNGKSFGDGGSRERAENEKRRQAEEKERRNKNFKNYEEDTPITRAKRVGKFNKPEIKVEEKEEEKIKVISVPDSITIGDLASKMRIQAAPIIKKLFLEGKIVTVNSELTYEEAENIAIEYEIICEKEIPVDVIEELLKEDEDDPSTLTKRPPVVVVMGHVDHGKTSLLDKIRQSNVLGREAGGITQRIGAYSVKINGQSITFLDTPGHEAFTAMRMRGANSTDIAILVVAADDGVMPQTIEAINHAKAAGVEIIVAVNKIDKPEANIERVKQELTEYELISTDWGGSTEFVPVSAKMGEGIDTLLETIILTADILELKANPNREARALVLEAKLDKGRGPVANVLIQKGTLHVGDFISAGSASGKVRAMMDDNGKRINKALPSQPVEILGLNDVPSAGEILVGHKSDKEAKQYANTYMQQHKKDLIDETKAKMSLDDLYMRIEEGKLKELNVIIKADVQGSVEALKSSLLKLSGEEVVVRVIHSGVGAINESDVTLASTSSAIIIGFDVKPDAQAKSLADTEGVELKLYNVIYQAIDEVEAAMKGMLAPIYEERITGHVEIRQIFKASAIGNIAGSYVTDGVVRKGSKVRISRGKDLIFEGDLKSLKRFKDDIKEVKEGYECGLVFDGFDQMNVGDTVEVYEMVEVPRS